MERRIVMRRIGLAIVVVLLLTGVTAFAAVASNPHFVVGPTFTVISSGALEATGSVAGLGNQNVTVVLSATGSRTCTNGGGNQPPGQRQTVSGSQTITNVENGRINFDVTTAALANACPDHMGTTVTSINATLPICHVVSLVLQLMFT